MASSRARRQFPPDRDATPRHEGIPVFTVENACASGSSAFNLATMALRAGSYDVALAVGVEKMNIPDKAEMFSAFDGGSNISTVASKQRDADGDWRRHRAAARSLSERPYSVFMDVYAALCRHHMKSFGTAQRQIAAVAASIGARLYHPLSRLSDLRRGTGAGFLADRLSAHATDVLADQRWRGCGRSLQRRRFEAPERRRRWGGAVLASIVQTGGARSIDEPRKIVAHLAAKKAFD